MLLLPRLPNQDGLNHLWTMSQKILLFISLHLSDILSQQWKVSKARFNYQLIGMDNFWTLHPAESLPALTHVAARLFYRVMKNLCVNFLLLWPNAWDKWPWGGKFYSGYDYRGFSPWFASSIALELMWQWWKSVGEDSCSAHGDRKQKMWMSTILEVRHTTQEDIPN